MVQDFINITQGYATVASGEEIEKDTQGITNPNLHRRIATVREQGDQEYKPRDYTLSVNGVSSYRNTKEYVYNDSDNHNEIP